VLRHTLIHAVYKMEKEYKKTLITIKKTTNLIWMKFCTIPDNYPDTFW